MPLPKKPCVTVVRTRVRCLGPGKGEHFFGSAAPAAERVCARCRSLQDKLALSARHAGVKFSTDGLL